MSINALIISSLKHIAPIAFHHYTGSETTYMTFLVYNQREGLVADNEEKTTLYSVQIDIYSKGNVETLAKQVKAALKPHGFRRVSEQGFYNIETQTYRRMITFAVALPNQD